MINSCQDILWLLLLTFNRLIIDRCLFYSTRELSVGICVNNFLIFDTVTLYEQGVLDYIDKGVTPELLLLLQEA